MEGEWAHHSARMIVGNEIFSKRKPTKKNSVSSLIWFGYEMSDGAPNCWPTWGRARDGSAFLVAAVKVAQSCLPLWDPMD